MRITQKQSGFTAVELLITLFVAAAFLIASYQLFNLIIRDGGAARAESRAGNVAYDYMRRYIGNATNPCTTLNPLNNAPITVDGLIATTVSVAITCPLSASANTVSKVEVTVKYNMPEQTVKYATFSSGPGSATDDVLNGLVGWWKLNGNPDSSIGVLPGTFTGYPTSTTGQNGVANNAYSFSGSGQYIDADNPGNLPLLSTARTLCGWGRPSSVAAGIRVIAAYGDSSNDQGMLIAMNGTSAVAGSQGTNVTVTSVWAVNVWHHLCMTYNGASTTTFYIDGVSRSTTAQSWTTRNNNVYIGKQATASTSLNWAGAIDDVRLYNRALTASEVLSIYTLGAR